MQTTLILHILIVDDDPICSAILKRMITLLQLPGRKATLNITILHSAEEALDVLKNTKYDIMFTDIEMGGMWGDEMVRTICSKFDYDIPIYAITAKCDAESCERYKDAGITRCLAKPAMKKSIQDIIENRVEHIIRNSNL
jgi:CheY-like chemotaxis protein